MEAIVLQAVEPATEEINPKAEGYTHVPYTHRARVFNQETREYTGEIEDYKGTRVLFPEIGPARQFTWTDKALGIVVTINGHNYRVGIEVSGTNLWGNGPTKAAVAFIPTEEPETPFKAFDLDADVKTLLSDLATSHKRMADFYVSHPDAKLDAEHRILNLENGAERLWPAGPVTFFGQPQFIQSDVLPQYEGRAVMHLATLNTGHGDSGNVNILFTCDDNGVPVHAWFEGSCC